MRVNKNASDCPQQGTSWSNMNVYINIDQLFDFLIEKISKLSDSHPDTSLAKSSLDFRVILLEYPKCAFQALAKGTLKFRIENLEI